MPRLDIQVALGIGAGGALVDVSDKVRLPDTVTYRWGRNDAYFGAEPGVVSFTLDNFDGRFTPDNPNSTLATTLVEGAAACIKIGGRLTACTVRSIEPAFPGDIAAWSVVKVTCDDSLRVLSRRRISDPTVAAAIASLPGGVWPFSDPVGSTLVLSVAGYFGAAGPFFADGNVNVEFGVRSTAPGGGDQATLSANAGKSGVLTVTRGSSVEFAQPFGDGEYLSVWITPRNETSFVEIQARLTDPLLPYFGETVRVGVRNNRFAFWDGSGYVLSDPFTVDRPYFISASFVSPNFTYKINGVTVATGTDFSTPPGYPSATITVGDAAYGDTEFSIANLAVTQTELFAHDFLSSSTVDYYDALAQLAPLTVTANANLEGAHLTAVDVDGSSVLDAFNQLADTEQGHLIVETTGTLTSPVSTVRLRERDRPATITTSFNVEDELSGAPAFVRDITNLVSTAVVSGATNKVIVEDAALESRSGGASTSDTVLLVDRGDLRHWGEDRLLRGQNTTMQIRSVVVDAMTTPTDRSADLLALLPGDRVRFTGLPDTQLGFTFWDGWFLGAEETHTVEEHSFVLYFQPVLDDTAVLDTSLYMADGALTLSATADDSTTSLSVASSDSMVRLETVDVPYTLQIDDEHIRVTACTSATPQVLTVVRGVNGTTAAAHLVDAPVEVADLTGEYQERFFRYPSTTLYPSLLVYPTGFKPSWSLYAF